MSVLEHLRPEDQPRVMGQVCRLLRPGGLLVVGLPGVNWLMSLGFRLLGYDIRKHHFSRSRIVLEAAAQVMAVERVVRQPPFPSDALLAYLWFRARKTRDCG